MDEKQEIWLEMLQKGLEVYLRSWKKLNEEIKEFVSCKYIYKDYSSWCEMNEYPKRNKIRFCKSLTKNFGKSKIKRIGEIVLRGYEIKREPIEKETFGST